MTRPLLLAALLFASLGATPASGRMVTIYFTGEVVTVVNMVTDATVPSAVGMPFYGYVTYDVADPEHYVNIINEYGQPFAQAAADSGCGQLLNGVCTQDNGTNAPVITDYRVTWNTVTYAPFDRSLGFYDGTQRYNQSVGGSPSGEVWGASRNQFRREMTGDPDGAYQYSQSQRVIGINASITSSKPNLLKKPASNLEQGFDLKAVPSAQQTFILRDGVARVNCVYPNSCPEQFDAGSFQLYGILKSVSFNSGKPPK